jgi:hypothetical protein
MSTRSEKYASTQSSCDEFRCGGLILQDLSEVNFLLVSRSFVYQLVWAPTNLRTLSGYQPRPNTPREEYIVAWNLGNYGFYDGFHMLFSCITVIIF